MEKSKREREKMSSVCDSHDSPVNDSMLGNEGKKQTAVLTVGVTCYVYLLVNIVPC